MLLSTEPQTEFEYELHLDQVAQCLCVHPKTIKRYLEYTTVRQRQPWDLYVNQAELRELDWMRRWCNLRPGSKWFSLESYLEKRVQHSPDQFERFLKAMERTNDSERISE